MNNIYFWIAIFLYYLVSIYIGYIIGFKNGFNKSKKIDDEIIKELTNKYKNKD